jgi:mitofilin
MAQRRIAMAALFMFALMAAAQVARAAEKPENPEERAKKEVEELDKEEEKLEKAEKKAEKLEKKAEKDDKFVKEFKKSCKGVCAKVCSKEKDVPACNTNCLKECKQMNDKEIDNIFTEISKIVQAAAAKEQPAAAAGKV